MANLSVRACPRVKTILNDVMSQELNGISDKQAQRTLKMLDQWIDDCERHCKWELDLPSGRKSARRVLATQCLDDVTKLRKYRSTIQSDAQTFWGLAIVSAIQTATMAAKLSNKIEWDAKHYTITPSLKKSEIVAVRRKWLSDRIQELGLTKDDIEASRKHRSLVRRDYKGRFRMSDKTFSGDMKALHYRPR